MPESLSISEAEENLDAVVQRVEHGSSVQITRKGKPVAVLMSVEEYAYLADQRKDFREALMDFRHSVEKENVEITGRDFEGLRDRTAGRNPFSFNNFLQSARGRSSASSWKSPTKK